MTPAELRTLRASTGLSQERFANDVVGVSVEAIRRWEQAKTPIPHLSAIAVRSIVADWLKMHQH